MVYAIRDDHGLTNAAGAGGETSDVPSRSFLLVTCGKPQGPILDPRLCIIHTNYCSIQGTISFQLVIKYNSTRILSRL